MQKERAVQPHPKLKVTQSARRLGAQLFESLRRVTTRSFANNARPMAFPSQPTTPLTAVAMTAGKPSESKKPYRKSWGNKGMAFMQSMFEAYVKSQNKADEFFPG